MRLPRDVSGNALAAALAVLGYAVTRQTGSHMRLTTAEDGEHHLTIPRHDFLRIGTLADILADVQAHHGLTREALLAMLNLQGRCKLADSGVVASPKEKYADEG